MASHTNSDPSPNPAPSPNISPKTSSQSNKESRETSSFPSNSSFHASDVSDGFDNPFDDRSNNPPKSNVEANSSNEPSKPDHKGSSSNEPDPEANISESRNQETANARTLDEIFGSINPLPELRESMAALHREDRIWDRSTFSPPRGRVSVLFPPVVPDDRIVIPHRHLNVLEGYPEGEGIEDGDNNLPKEGNKDGKDNLSNEGMFEEMSRSSTGSDDFEGSRLAAALRKFHEGQLSPREEKTYDKSEGPVSREHFEEYRELMEDQVRDLSGFVFAAANKQWNAVRDLEIYKIKAAREKEKAELAERLLENTQKTNNPASTDSKESTRYTTASEGGSRSQESVKETAIPLTKPIRRPFQPVQRSEPMRRIGRLKREMRELAIDLSILTAKALWLQGDPEDVWNRMENVMTESIHRATMIESSVLIEKCEYYRGIGRFGLQDWWGARDSFMRAGGCAEVYAEGKDARGWYKKTEEMIMLSPGPTTTPGTARAINSANVRTWAGWLPWDTEKLDDDENDRLEAAWKEKLKLAKSASSEKPRSDSEESTFSTKKPGTPPGLPLPNTYDFSCGGSTTSENPRTPDEDPAAESGLVPRTGSTPDIGANDRAPIPSIRIRPTLSVVTTGSSGHDETQRIGRSTTRMMQTSQRRPFRISTDRSSRSRVRVARSTSPKDATTTSSEPKDTAQGADQANQTTHPKRASIRRRSRESDGGDGDDTGQRYLSS